MAGAASTVLERSGVISLGRSTTEQPELCLQFSVQRGNSQIAGRAQIRKGPGR